LRYYPSLAALCVYLLFTMLWNFAPGAYAALLHTADAMPQTPRPFSDLGAILQAGACWREGVNVYAPSACMGGGVFNYSPLLLHAALLPIGPQDRLAGGVLLGLAFLLSLAWLPPPASRAEVLVRVAASCSCTVIFALERANLDVAIFLLVLLALALLRRGRWAIAGYAMILLAAAAKFYPAVLLALLARERLAFLLGALALIGGGGAVYLLCFGHGTLVALRMLPVGFPFWGIFGAADIPFGIALLCFMPVMSFTPDATQYLAGVHHAGVLTIIQLGSRLMTISALVAGVKEMPAYRDAFKATGERPALLLLAGCLVMVFCFFLAQNIPYRAIFLLITLPGLWAMRAQRMVVAVLILLWEDFLRNLVWDAANFVLPPADVFYPEFLFWLFCECLWWWLIIQFCAICACFLRDSLARRWGEAAVGLTDSNV
jgi:hypothetical protein